MKIKLEYLGMDVENIERKIAGLTRNRHDMYLTVEVIEE